MSIFPKKMFRVVALPTRPGVLWPAATKQTSHYTMEHPAFTLSALCSIGGVMGYMRKGSLPSLIGGVAVGSLFGFAGYLLKENANGGLETALVASTLLLGAGLPRAIKLRKPVPMGISVLALVSLGYYGKKWSDFNM